MTRRTQRYTPNEHGIPTRPVDNVNAWPVYLLKRIPPELRENLGATAVQMDWSVADVIRDTLCAHYRLDCPPRSYTYSGGLKPGTEQMVLRLQPELWKAIRDDKNISGRPIRSIVIETLQKRYENEEETP